MTDEKSVAQAFEFLHEKDNSIAYKVLQELQEISEKTNLVYPFMDKLGDMLDSDSSYIRTRALTLIAYNARWDKDCKIDEVIGTYLEHITDGRPITARQCIKLLPVIAKDKPELRGDIIKALRNADVSTYSDSMRSLVRKDIAETLIEIEGME